MVASIIVPLLIYPYVSRILQAEGIGKVTFAQSVIYYFTMIAQLGVPTYGIRECAKVRDDKEALSKLVKEILIINAVTCLVSYALFMLCLFTIPQMRENKALFYVMSASTILQVIGVEWFYSGIEKYDYLTIVALIFRVLMVIGAFVFIKTGEDYIWYGVILVLGASGYGIINCAILPKYISFKRNGKYDLKRHLKPIFVFFAMSVAVTIYTQMDSVMLGFIKGTTENGYYDAAVKIKMLMVSFITSLGTVIMPRAAYHLERDENEKFNELAGKAMSFVVALSVPFCIYFILYASPAIMLLSGEGFISSIAPMKLIMPTIVLIGITNIIGIQVMVPLKREKGVLYAEISGAVINLIVNAALIPKLGAAGAAIGTVIAEAVVLIVECIYTKDLLYMMFKNVNWLKIVIATIAGAIASIWTLKLKCGSFLILLISAVLFFAVYAAIMGRDMIKNIKAE